MIDTHTHLYLADFPEGGVREVAAALDAGVRHLVFPNVDRDTVAPMLALHEKFPEATSMAMGLHPTSVGENSKEILDEVGELLGSGKFVAVGEVGMDLYWDTTFRKEQMDVFAEQLRMADSAGLPVIIHCREALEETLAVIKSTGVTVPLIFHSFTGSPDDVRKIREVCDPMFGINGVVTFKNAAPLRDSLSEIGEERILLETDSPYLAPVPMRGKRNESAWLPYVCGKIAEVLDKTAEEVSDATDKNACKIFRI